jgi:hypothetical protein
MANVALFDLPPPGAGFCTVILAVPAVAMKEAAICAETLEALA